MLPRIELLRKIVNCLQTLEKEGIVVIYKMILERLKLPFDDICRSTVSISLYKEFIMFAEVAKNSIINYETNCQIQDYQDTKGEPLFNLDKDFPQLENLTTLNSYKLIYERVKKLYLLNNRKNVKVKKRVTAGSRKTLTSKVECGKKEYNNYRIGSRKKDERGRINIFKRRMELLKDKNKKSKLVMEFSKKMTQKDKKCKTFRNFKRKKKVLNGKWRVNGEHRVFLQLVKRFKGNHFIFKDNKNYYKFYNKFKKKNFLTWSRIAPVTVSSDFVYGNNKKSRNHKN